MLERYRPFRLDRLNCRKTARSGVNGSNCFELTHPYLSLHRKGRDAMRTKHIVLAVLAASFLLVGAAGAAAAQPAENATATPAENASEERPGDAGPPEDMPEQVPSFVSDIHSTINEFLSGDIDNLGAAVSDIASEEAPDDAGGADEAAEESEDAEDNAAEESEDTENNADDEAADDADEDADDADEDADDADDDANA